MGPVALLLFCLWGTRAPFRISFSIMRYTQRALSFNILHLRIVNCFSELQLSQCLYRHFLNSDLTYSSCYSILQIKNQRYRDCVTLMPVNCFELLSLLSVKSRKSELIWNKCARFSFPLFSYLFYVLHLPFPSSDN